MIDDRKFRDAMAQFTTGVTVVTTEYEDKIMGMTVNAFMSISLDPKIVAISIDEKAEMYDVFPKTNTFGVSILRDDQVDESMIFASQKEDNGTIEYNIHEGVPVLKDSLATIACDIVQSTKVGDHTVFFGQVKHIELKEGNPLVYYGSDYQAIK